MGDLTTEARNPRSTDLDRLTSLELVELMNAEDRKVIDAVKTQVEPIARAIDEVAHRLARGGRLIYIGAGTSGRLGVLDAAEIPPTFSAPEGTVIGLIAGGEGALVRAVEGAEDDPENGAAALREIELSGRDTVVGIASSGVTPFVVGALEYARGIGALTIALACNRDSPAALASDIAIEPVVGPEVLSGSTRLKAGTATKLVLNTLSTGVMVRLGKTYGNLMVDLAAVNAKLRDRSRRIVAQATELPGDQAGELLDRCGGEVKTAIVSALLKVEPDEARETLHAVDGRVRAALEWDRD